VLLSHNGQDYWIPKTQLTADLNKKPINNYYGQTYEDIHSAEEPEKFY